MLSLQKLESKGSKQIGLLNLLKNYLFTYNLLLTTLLGLLKKLMKTVKPKRFCYKKEINKANKEGKKTPEIITLYLLFGIWSHFLKAIK